MTQDNYDVYIRKMRIDAIEDAQEKLKRADVLLETYVASEKTVDATIKDKHVLKEIEEASKLVHNASVRVKRALIRLKLKSANSTVEEEKNGDNRKDVGEHKEQRTEDETSKSL